MVSDGWDLYVYYREKRLELCVVEEKECWGQSRDRVGGRNAPASCFLALPLPTNPSCLSALRSLYSTSGDLIRQQHKRQNMEEGFPLCVRAWGKKHHEHLDLQKEIILSQICTKTSDRLMQMKDHRRRWRAGSVGNVPSTTHAGEGLLGGGQALP